MVMTTQEELYRMQRKLHRRNREIINHSILVKEPGFEAYEKRYLRKVARYRSIVSHEEMMGAILKADIIYVGDYHTCNQSQRSFLRILKAIAKKTTNFTIGLELIHQKYQPLLDKYLNGRLKDGTFLEKIGFHQHWVFDLWANFRPIFDFAKYHHISMIALDATTNRASLKKRDEAAGRRIAEFVMQNPGKKIFIFIGDLHLAPEHLPAEVDRALARIGGGLLLPRQAESRSCREARGCNDDGTRQFRNDVRAITLFQNSEPIYWRLAKQGMEDQVEVVKIDDESFCRMHTPPVIAQQSYINWLEHEEGEIDFSDAKHSFLEIVHRIAKFLDLKLGKGKDNVEVYTSGDLSFLKKLKEKKSFSDRELGVVKRQIMASESYYIAKERIVYLANLSINHAAEEAAHFIKHLPAGPEFPRYLVDAFYANILHEALGFFGSKIINSKRKCLHEAGFKNLSAYFESIRIPHDRELEYEATRLVTEYLKFERRGKPLRYTPIFEQDADLFMAVTHALGYMLGDKMYYAMKAGKIDRLTLRYLFYDKWEGEGRPFEIYSSIREKVKGVRIPKRM